MCKQVLTKPLFGTNALRYSRMILLLENNVKTKLYFPFIAWFTRFWSTVIDSLGMYLSIWHKYFILSLLRQGVSQGVCVRLFNKTPESVFIYSCVTYYSSKNKVLSLEFLIFWSRLHLTTKEFVFFRLKVHLLSF